VLDLNETIAGMEKMLRRLIGEDVELCLDLAPGVGCVHADPGQLEQVVMNLAVNARDAMPRGGTLTLETSGIDGPDGLRIRLSVTDTGTGMDEGTRARIFEPFFTTKERDRGTGLGLSTVLGIIEQSGGSIDVQSEPGRGTRFDILLPRTSGTPTVERSIVPSPSTLRGSETILLVEDEAQVRRLARVILERSGYRVIEASNAGEALLIAEDPSHRFDLLLTDVVMPRCTGHALAKRLRAQRPELPVLYMSGYPDDSIATYGVLTPGIRLLHKPLQPVPLLAAVRSVLDDESERVAAPPSIELPATR
jgi:CheY-like chemotaxis protein